MPTFGDVLGQLEERLFVGRARELALFRRWLEADVDAPEILNVSGPGGVGKSALLRAFGRVAAADRRSVICLDGGAIRAYPRSLLVWLAEASGLSVSAERSPDLEAVVTALNRRQPLVLLDTFEQFADLTAYVRDELLPRLDARVRVVIASRQPLGLAWSRHDRWHRLVRPLRLAGLAPVEAWEYLRRRGLAEPSVVEGLLQAVGGHPLALALAADLALQRGVRNFRSAPQWRLAVRMLVERLFEDLDDRELRGLLEAGGVTRQFDQATLAAVAGPEAAGAFERLWCLSMVQPAEGGLMLHDDVRRILADDLRWRDPARYRKLRLRALAHYRERMGLAQGEERERLLAEQFFLWEDAFVRDLLFADAEPGQVWLEPGRPEDHDEVLRIWAIWLDEILPALFRPRFDREQDRAFLRALLAYPGTRLRIARDVDGRALGFNTFLPVCRTSLPMLERHPGVLPTVRAYLGTADPVRLPERPEDATVFYLLHIAHTDVQPNAVRAALARDLLGMLARGGVFLAASPVPAYQQLLERMGWQRLADARNAYWSDAAPTEGYMLDLRRTGVDAWMTKLVGMQMPPAPVRPLGAPAAEGASGADLDLKGTKPLSRRERELAALVARGMQNREIAARLDLSVRTVDAHVEHIRRKLGAHSRAEIAAWAAQQGLIDADHG